MKPRIFISSTYYDLKFVRERLEQFIEHYGFEPILFESDKVTFEHNKPVDVSAYNEVALCQMMILIIGGRYGSPSSLQSDADSRKKYDDEYVSITQKEFETALKKNIPVFIFIDKNVYVDYQNYRENIAFFELPEQNSHKFKFVHVDHVNIFRFIDLVKVKPIKTFERIEEIEGYLTNQFSGMFYLYLEDLQKKNEERQVLNMMSELNNVTIRMSEMLNVVGAKILGPNNEEYKNIIKQQLVRLFEFFSKQVFDYLTFKETEETISEEQSKLIAEILINKVLNIPLPPVPDKKLSLERRSFRRIFNEEVQNTINQDLLILFPDGTITLEKLNAYVINKTFKDKVLPFMKSPNDQDILLNTVADDLYYVI